MLTETTLTGAELLDLWQQLAQDESLPERYELTENGELVMSPSPTNRQQIVCSEIAFQLRSQLGGKAVTETAVLTRTAGVRKPDVVWMPSARWAALSGQPEGADILSAPDLAVEVLSPRNRRAEIAHKVAAYLASGTTEVVVVALDGAVVFHHADGAHAESVLGVRLDLPSDLFA